MGRKRCSLMPVFRSRPTSSAGHWKIRADGRHGRGRPCVGARLPSPLVWEIDRRLQEDQARPIVYHLRFATCWQNRVRGLRMMVNSVFNGWRFEDVWLEN